jgi:hypothetical protein
MNIQIFFGVVAIMAGITAILWQLWIDHKVRQSRQWPIAEGKILRSEIHRKEQSMGDAQSGRAIIYSATVEYEYAVDGRTFRGQTLCIGGVLDTSSRSRAENRCEKYPPQSTVYVHYDPEDHSTACLETTGEYSPWSYLLAIVFILCGLWFKELGQARLSKPDLSQATHGLLHHG